MEICALSSGSSGNCFYIENNSKGILVDCGISSKQIVERLFSIQKNPSNINGIFITHEHSDHIRGADVFARKFNIPIFANKKTIESSHLCSNLDLINVIKNEENIKINGLDICAISKSHKAADPVLFNIINGKKVSIMTDLGYACNNVIDNIKDSDMLLIESNYDPKMLENGPYPYFLKKWITSDIGHLSNSDSAKSVFEHSKKKLKNLVLCHLSKNNNHPELALSSFNILKNKPGFNAKIFVSERERSSPIFKI